MAAKKKAQKKKAIKKSPNGGGAGLPPRPPGPAPANPGRIVPAKIPFPEAEVRKALEAQCAFAVRILELGSDKQYLVEAYRPVSIKAHNTDSPDSPVNAITVSLVKACLLKHKWKGDCSVIVVAVPYLGQRFQESISGA